MENELCISPRIFTTWLRILLCTAKCVVVNNLYLQELSI